LFSLFSLFNLFAAATDGVATKRCLRDRR
jgi:hypothetical protein